MFGIQKIDRHARLLNGVAESLRIDLPGALAGGRITGEGLRAAVFNCTACARPDACAARLASGEPASAAPPFCRNAELFAALSA